MSLNKKRGQFYFEHFLFRATPSPVLPHPLPSLFFVARCHAACVTPRTHEKYVEELWSHLVKIRIETVPELRRLCASLVFKRKYPWGRTVQRNRGRVFGLRHGDRLALGGPILNIHDLDDLAVPTDVFSFGLGKPPRSAASV